MSLPASALRTLAATPLRLIVLRGARPTFATAQVRSIADRRLALVVDTPLQEGDRLILEGGALRADAVVEACERGVTHVFVDRILEPEKRAFPRVDGELPLVYWRGGRAAEFLRGEPPEGPWSVPDPFVNFSATGLSFDDDGLAGPGETVLLQLDVPGQGRWRAVARVIRSTPIPMEQRPSRGGRTHQLVVVFDVLPAEAAQALAEYALQLQDAWLDDLTQP